MRRGVSLAFASLLALAGAGPPAVVAATETTPESLFAAGNASYEQGDYVAAIEAYTALVERGVQHPSLDYNLANAYFKAGDLGRAVLWYERARRLAPRNEDVRENLALVRTLVRDRQLVVEPAGVRRWLTAWHRDATVSESIAVASGLYLLLCVLAMCTVFRRARWVSAAYRRVSFLSPARLFGLDMTQDLALALSLLLALTLAFAGSSWVKIHGEREHPRGVVVVEEVPVFSGPSRDATMQFKVHEGTVVSVHDQRSGWVRVDLPGDLSGWVDAASLERI